MTQRLTITVPGEPVGWGRPTPVAKLTGEGVPFVSMVTQKATREAKKRVRDLFKAKYPGHRPWTGPVLLRFTAVFQTPQSFNRALKDAAARGELYAVKKPDKDNIEKLIKDALNGVVYADDQQVMGGGIKRYGSPPRVEISFELLGTADSPATPSELRATRAQQRPLALEAPRAAKKTPTKSQSDPDLRAYPERQRALIERALARDAAAKGARHGK